MQELTGRIITREDRVLDVLSTTYPAYRIERTAEGWRATRHRAVTAEEAAWGIVGRLRRDDALSLSSALSAQHGILHNHGEA